MHSEYGLSADNALAAMVNRVFLIF